MDLSNSMLTRYLWFYQGCFVLSAVVVTLVVAAHITRNFWNMSDSLGYFRLKLNLMSVLIFRSDL